jgi:hypothetical protein
MTCKPKHTLSVCAAGLFASCLSGSVQAGALNDTGVTSCSNGTATVTCSSVDATYPGQDASFGRDAAAATGALTKVGSGPVGFDFTKLDMSGTAVPDSAVKGSGVGQHACTRDNVTGLVWDVLHNKLPAYWYDTNSATNGGNTGPIVINGTNFHVAAANTNNQCGGTGWRLPTVRELVSISDIGQGKRPTGYFSTNDSDNNCPGLGFVWSSQSVRGVTLNAWVVQQGGGVVQSGKDTGKFWTSCVAGSSNSWYNVYVMLVR